MGRFTGPLITRELGYESWDIWQPFDYISDSGIRIKIHRGARTDLASIPQILRSYIPKFGYWAQAAAVHDQITADHREGRDIIITRLQADRILREAARDKAIEYNIPKLLWRNQELYYGVRIGGLSSWQTPADRAARAELFDNTDIQDG